MVPVRRNQNWMSNIFNDIFDDNFMVRTSTTAPAINVVEKERSYELELAAPGMTKEDFNVTLDHEGDLVIKMEKKVEKKEEGEKGHYLRREWDYTKFQQTMLLPDDADREKISAKVDNGVLSVSIPKIAKVKAEDTNRLIEIQ
ncbi:MAG: Hsp20/alpha crystallin family protein [Bacteroidales bacterium]|nr:Hsp20/alpha crystallin family protein [Bacteroidales bacterium]